MGIEELYDFWSQPVVLLEKDPMTCAWNSDQLRLWDGAGGELRIRPGYDAVSGPVDDQSRVADLREWIPGKPGHLKQVI